MRAKSPTYEPSPAFKDDRPCIRWRIIYDLPPAGITVHCVYSLTKPIENSEQLGLPPSLKCVFTLSGKLSYQLRTEQRYHSDWIGVQGYLSICNKRKVICKRDSTCGC